MTFIIIFYQQIYIQWLTVINYHNKRWWKIKIFLTNCKTMNNMVYELWTLSRPYIHCPFEMKLSLERQYMLSVLHSQYHACWCSGEFRSRSIIRWCIDPQSRNIPSPTSVELTCRRWGTHIWVRTLHHLWFLYWPVYSLPPRHYLSQYWMSASQTEWPLEANPYKWPVMWSLGCST